MYEACMEERGNLDVPLDRDATLSKVLRRRYGISNMRLGEAHVQ